MYKFKSSKKISFGSKSFTSDRKGLYVYSTTDEKEIALLKKCHVRYEIVEEKGTKNAEQNTANTVKSEGEGAQSYPEIENLQQAKHILTEHYGLPKNTPAEKILEKAAEAGVMFPNLAVTVKGEG